MLFRSVENRVGHRGENALAEHISRAVAVKTQAGVALSSQKSPGPIELARCFIWAAAVASRPTTRPKPAIGFSFSAR